MSSNRRSGIPWGLLGAIAAVMAIEGAVARLDLVLTRSENFDWRQARHAAGSRTAGCDVLCFGTSMVAQGILPEVIEQKSGLRTQNLAVCAGRSVYAYYYLRQALASGARPKAALVDFHPAYLKSHYEIHSGWADLLGFRDCVDLAWTLKDPQFFVQPILDKTVPSIYERMSIRFKILDALRGNEVSNRFVNLQYLRNHNRNKGSLVSQKNPYYQGEIAPVYRVALLDQPFACFAAEEFYLRRFLDLAAAHGVRVYWVVMPLCPSLEQNREARGLNAKYTEFVNSFAGDPNLVVLDARSSGYVHHVFTDACHLDVQGAFNFSSDVAEVLRREREGTAGAGHARWVKLPTYRERPIDVAIETAVDSEVALKQLMGIRR